MFRKIPFFICLVESNLKCFQWSGINFLCAILVISQTWLWNPILNDDRLQQHP